MIKLLAAGLGLGLALAAGYAVTVHRPASEEDVAREDVARRTDYAKLFAEVDLGKFDPASIPMNDGIVWYGTWEAAMAEKERTGKPVMLHFGSPRAPSEQTVCVPGMW